MQVLRTEYSTHNNKPTVHVFTRDKNGKRTVIKDQTLTPYFYVPVKEAPNKVALKSIMGEELSMIQTRLPEDVPKIRDSFTKTFEADVLFPIRYLIDKVDVIDKTTAKILYIDVEVEVVNKFPKPSEALDAVICVGLYDNLSEIYTTFIFRQDFQPGISSGMHHDRYHEIRHFSSEKLMLKELMKFIRETEPDVITGWNVIAFDLLYLINRMKNLGIDYTEMSPMDWVYVREDEGDVIIKGVAVVDLMMAYRTFSENQEVSYALDYLAKKVLGHGKTDTGTNVRWLWNYKIDELIGYNINDVSLTVDINEKMGLLDFMDELRRMSFCQLEDTMVMTKISDSYILRQFHGKKIFPTKRHNERYEYEGAFVASWAKGLYDNIVVFDLKSLYPSIIVSANLSPETVSKKETKDSLFINNVWVRQDIEGFLPQVINGLFDKRAFYKKLKKGAVIDSEEYKMFDYQQKAVKRVMNALYGQTAYPNSRIYNALVAETITFVGREVITWSKSHMESKGHPVRYVDTDSLLWQAVSADINVIESIREELNNTYVAFARQWGFHKNLFSMEFDKLCRKAFWSSARKRYAFHIIYQDGKTVDTVTTMGFETRRSDSSELTRKILNRVFEMLLKEDSTKEEVLRYIGDEIDKLRKGKYELGEIGIPKGINKEIDSYKPMPANVRGAKYSRDILKLDLSSKPKMIYVSKVPGELPETDVLCFDDAKQIPGGTVIDIETMLDKLVKNKIENIFEALGWSLKDLVYYWHGKPESIGEQTKLAF
jgi:DNA polymerase I